MKRNVQYLELTDDEIKAYRDKGIIVEELDKFPDGGKVNDSKPVTYTHPSRPGVRYQKGQFGWMINIPGKTNGYVPIKDPDGKRAAELNKNAVPATEEDVKNKIYEDNLRNNKPGTEKTESYNNNDSNLENVIEILDPTGITSWDDVYRSYVKSGMSPETAIEILGALPFIGKFGKVSKVLSKEAFKLLTNPKAIQAVTKRGMPIAPIVGVPVLGAASLPYIGRVSDTYQALDQYVNEEEQPVNTGPTKPGVFQYEGMDQRYKFPDGGKVTPKLNASEKTLTPELNYDRGNFHLDGSTTIEPEDYKNYQKNLLLNAMYNADLKRFGSFNADGSFDINKNQPTNYNLNAGYNKSFRKLGDISLNGNVIGGGDMPAEYNLEAAYNKSLGRFGDLNLKGSVNNSDGRPNVYNAEGSYNVNLGRGTLELNGNVRSEQGQPLSYSYGAKYRIPVTNNLTFNAGYNNNQARTYNANAGLVFSFDKGGSVYKTKLNDADEKAFQIFFNTLPENLKIDDESYDIRGYWDAEGRPNSFNYNQPKEEDGYYHAYSINPNTGEYLKAPWHHTFNLAVNEDKKMGYRPLGKVNGRIEAFYNPGLISDNQNVKPEHFLINQNGPLAQYENGGNVSKTDAVSKIWESVTGTPWSEAKASGKTDGTYAGNIKLKAELLKQLNTTPSSAQTTNIKSNEVVSETPSAESNNVSANSSFIKLTKNDAANFNEAFKIARNKLGVNAIFEYDGRKYGTNLQGELFKPSNEVLAQAGLNNQETKDRLKVENELVDSPYVNKKTVKLQPDGYASWDDVKERDADLNKKSNAELIIEYNKKRNIKKNYAIVDKKKGLLHIYQPDGKLLYTSAVDLGANKGDAQTVTKVKDLNGDGIITEADRINGKYKADWDAGNHSTGAGRFYISNIDKKGYEGLPILNMMNESQYDKFLKTGKVENVSTSFHTGYIKDDQNRVSNGCVRCNKPTLNQLSNKLENTSEVFILPEDEGNKFVLENGTLVLKANAKTNYYTYNGRPDYVYKKENDKWYIENKKTGKFIPINDPNGARTKELNKNAVNAKYNIYEDKNGIIRKGQGYNKTVNSLNYVPIKTTLNTEKFKSEKFTAFDFNDEEELKKVQTFTNALASNKKDIMKAAKINGDVYNEIAKITFGIFGTESNFADTHSALGNFARAVAKYSNPSTSSSPDYDAKYHTYNADKKSNSVGLTQMRWSYLNDDEKNALKEVGITSNKDFLNPKKAAIGTAVILGIRYNQQLNDKQKQDIWKYLPTKWNTRSNYADRVKNNSKYLTITQQEKQFENGGNVNFWEDELSDEEIAWYKNRGFKIEELD